MDGETEDVLSRLSLPDLKVIRLEDFERNDSELKSARRNRSRVEYYFTCTPSLPLFILKNFPAVDLITYIDADTFFFSSPEPLFGEIGKSSIAIIGHRFSRDLEYLKVHGLYNVCWLSFKNDDEAVLCLRWWRDRCNEWCGDRPSDGRFADQKYLDDWPSRFKNVAVLQHKGADLAYWNIQNYVISVNDGAVYIDGQPLIFFHFHAVKQITSRIYDSGFHRKIRVTQVMRSAIFEPYLRELSGIHNDLLSQVNKDFSLKSDRRLANDFGFLSLLYRGIIAKKFIFLGDYRKNQV
jgi:hypothetical protein